MSNNYEKLPVFFQYRWIFAPKILNYEVYYFWWAAHNLCLEGSKKIPVWTFYVVSFLNKKQSETLKRMSVLNSPCFVYFKVFCGSVTSPSWLLQVLVAFIINRKVWIIHGLCPMWIFSFSLVIVLWIQKMPILFKLVFL